MFFFFFDITFADRLKSAMEERNIDTYLLANLINVSPSTVQRWLEGKFDPRHKNLARVADALDISSDYLLGRT